MAKAKEWLKVVGEFILALTAVFGCGMLARYGAERILKHIINGG